MQSGLILLVDSDRRVQKAFSRAAAERGLEIVTCDTARAGVNAACALEPTAIVTELELPDFDGYWVLSQIRDQPTDVAVTPIVVVTHEVDTSSRARTLQAGADVFLQKPIAAPDLLAQVCALVDMAQRILDRRRVSIIGAAPKTRPPPAPPAPKVEPVAPTLLSVPMVSAVEPPPPNTVPPDVAAALDPDAALAALGEPAPPKAPSPPTKAPPSSVDVEALFDEGGATRRPPPESDDAATRRPPPLGDFAPEGEEPITRPRAPMILDAIDTGMIPILPAAPPAPKLEAAEPKERAGRTTQRPPSRATQRPPSRATQRPPPRSATQRPPAKAGPTRPPARPSKPPKPVVPRAPQVKVPPVRMPAIPPPAEPTQSAKSAPALVPRAPALVPPAPRAPALPGAPVAAKVVAVKGPPAARGTSPARGPQPLRTAPAVARTPPPGPDDDDVVEAENEG